VRIWKHVAVEKWNSVRLKHHPDDNLGEHPESRELDVVFHVPAADWVTAPVL
jgi:hypothetical protein